MAAQTLEQRLADAVGPEHVVAVDDRVAGVPAPLAVRPGDIAGVGRVLAAAHASGAAVVARGAGTKLHWGAAPRRVDVLVDLSRMAAVVEHEPGDLVVHAQAGASLAALAAAVAGAGQRLALDEVVPGSTVGGVVATALSGPRRVAFGAVRDLLIGVTAVRADGAVTRSGGKVVKNVAGYDLGKLYTGSYGTLAVVTSAVFRLHPDPEAAAFVTATPRRLDDALAALRHSQASLSALEVEHDAGATTVVALLEGRAGAVADRAAAVAREVGGDARVNGQAPDGFGRLPLGRTTLKLTCGLAGVADLLADVTRLEGAHGARMTVRGSAGAGVLYAGVDAGMSAALLADLRAACARRHGFAVVLDAPDDLRPGLEVWGPAPGLELMRRVKREFDPTGVLAPGRFVGGI